MIRRQGGDHLFLLEDKERAAYFMNDLENVLGEGGHQVLFYPRSARIPYQEEGTDNANVAMRAEVMSKLGALRGKVCIVSFPEAVAEQVTTRKELKRNTYTIKRGDRISQDFLDDILIDYGFEKVDYVYEPGQYAIRGGIVDIFSFAFDHPYRIELFGDEVDGIRKFDPADQLSVGKMDRAVIVPDVGDQMLKEEREPFLDFLGRGLHSVGMGRARRGGPARQGGREGPGVSMTGGRAKPRHCGPESSTPQDFGSSAGWPFTGWWSSAGREALRTGLWSILDRRTSLGSTRTSTCSQSI